MTDGVGRGSWKRGRSEALGFEKASGGKVKLRSSLLLVVSAIM